MYFKKLYLTIILSIFSINIFATSNQNCVFNYNGTTYNGCLTFTAFANIPLFIGGYPIIGTFFGNFAHLNVPDSQNINQNIANDTMYCSSNTVNSPDIISANNNNFGDIICNCLAYYKSQNSSDILATIYSEKFSKRKNVFKALLLPIIVKKDPVFPFRAYMELPNFYYNLKKSRTNIPYYTVNLTNNISINKVFNSWYDFLTNAPAKISQIPNYDGQIRTPVSFVKGYHSGFYFKVGTLLSTNTCNVFMNVTPSNSFIDIYNNSAQCGSDLGQYMLGLVCYENPEN